MFTAFLGGVAVGVLIPIAVKRLYDPPKRLEIAIGSRTDEITHAVQMAFANAWKLSTNRRPLCYDVKTGAVQVGLEKLQKAAKLRAHKAFEICKESVDIVFGIELGEIYGHELMYEPANKEGVYHVFIVHVIYRGGSGRWEEKQLRTHPLKNVNAHYATKAITEKIEEWLKYDMIVHNYNLMSRFWRKIGAE